MNIDFELVFFTLVVSSGFILIIDIIFLRKKRVSVVNNLINRRASKEDILVPGQVPAIIEYSRFIFFNLLIVLILRSFLFEPFKIPSGSMMPTMRNGDYILVNKFAYGLRLPVIGTKVLNIGQPERGDVMVFYPPHEPNTYFIKRVAGIPGDNIKYDNKVLYINGEQIKQIASPEDSDTLTGRFVFDEVLGQKPHKIQHFGFRSSRNKTITLNQGEYFMLGDNRDNSLDSRSWGVVAEDRIVGKASVIWMHWNEFFSIPSFSKARVIQ